MRHRKIITGLVFILSINISCYSQVTNKNNTQFYNWANKNISEIETLELRENQTDIEPIRKIIGNAKVVCLGESRHDIHEQFVLKQRFIKYMVEEMGFTTFILESSLPYTEKINEFIKTGTGNIDEIMSQMPGWFLWDTEEMKEIIMWMREHNKKQNEDDKKIQFFGIDIVAPSYALNKLFIYLKTVDSAYYLSILEKDFAENDFNDNFWPKSMQAYSTFSTERKMNLKDNYSELLEIFENNKDGYIKTTSEKEYEHMLKFAYCVKQANRMFSAEKRIDMGLVRDSAMANNTLWIINKIAKNKKTIVWAHNVHIAKAEFEMTSETEIIKGMGYLLHQQLKNDMISIGAAFNEGEFTDWNQSFAPANENELEGMFAKFGYNYFLLDIREALIHENISGIFNKQQVIKGQNFEMTTIPNKSFDAFYFTKNITRVMPCEESLEKYRNMN